MSFLGGTALRIVYGSPRFSEDLDFDNFSLTEKDFAELADKIRVDLARQGYRVEIKNILMLSSDGNYKFMKNTQEDYEKSTFWIVDNKRIDFFRRI